MKWFLLMYVYACGTGTLSNNNAISISPACENREVRIEMPSIETCRQVRGVNPNARCLTEDIEEEPNKGSKLLTPPWTKNDLGVSIEHKP